MRSILNRLLFGALIIALVLPLQAQRNLNPTVLQQLSAPYRNALAPRGGVAFDGTSGARVVSTLTNQNIGTDPFSCVIGVRGASTQINSGLLRLTPDAASVAARSFSIEKQFNTPANLAVVLYGATPTDFRYLRFTDFFTKFAGKDYQLAVTRSGNSVTLWCNGEALTPNAEVTGGTPPAWSDTITGTYMVLGASASATASIETIRFATLYNLALSASDVQEIYELGGAVPERFKFGSQAAITTNGDFESGVLPAATGWTFTASGASTIANTAGAGVTGNGLVVTVDGANSAASFTQAAAVLSLGKAYRVRMATKVDSVVGGPFISSDSFSGFSISPGLAFSNYDAVLIADIASTLQPVFKRGSNCAGRTLTFDNISVVRVGAVVHLPLDDGIGFQLRDVSTNALHALMTTTGVSHVIPGYGPGSLRFTTSTNGNTQLGGQAIIPANGTIFRIYARARTGNPTVSVGTTSGGSNIVNSVVLTNSWSTSLGSGVAFSSAGSIWVSSNSTDVIDWDLRWEPRSP